SAFWSDRTDVVHPCSHYILVALIAFLLHFPLHFPLHFILDPDTPVGTRSIPRSDRSNVSDFPTFVSRVRSQGFKGRSRFDSCLETEVGVRFPIPTGFGCEVGRVGSKVLNKSLRTTSQLSNYAATMLCNLRIWMQD